MAGFSYSSWKRHWWAGFTKPEPVLTKVWQYFSKWRVVSYIVKLLTPNKCLLKWLFITLFQFRSERYLFAKVKFQIHATGIVGGSLKWDTSKGKLTKAVIIFHFTSCWEWVGYLSGKRPPSSHFHNPKWAKLTRFLKIYAISTSAATFLCLAP